MMLGSAEELALGSLGHMEAKDKRLLLLGTTDATGCHGLWAGSTQGPKGTGSGGESFGLIPLGRESLACSVGSLAWQKLWLGALRGLLWEIRQPAL